MLWALGADELDVIIVVEIRKEQAQEIVQNGLGDLEAGFLVLPQ